MKPRGQLTQLHISKSNLEPCWQLAEESRQRGVTGSPLLSRQVQLRSSSFCPAPATQLSSFSVQVSHVRPVQEPSQGLHNLGVKLGSHAGGRDDDEESEWENRENDTLQKGAHPES